MNKTFSFSRFGKYFVNDLRNTWKTGGISLLALGFLPVIAFTVTKLISLITGLPVNNSKFISVAYSCVSLACTTMIMPKKLYGGITDKKQGSLFLLIPASTFEKWLSMTLMFCLVIPVAVLAMLALSNLAVATVFPSDYCIPDLDLPEEFPISEFLWLTFGSWTSTIGVFALGALIFKKSKIALTILCTFAFSMALGSIIALFKWQDLDLNMDPETLLKFSMDVCIISVIASNILVFGAMYFRLKTIKH